MHTITFSYVVKGPLVVLEEWMALDLIHSGAAQANLPVYSNRTKTVSRASSASTQKTRPRSSPPPTTTVILGMSFQTQQARGVTTRH